MHIVGEKPVTLFTPALGDDVKNLPQFITSLPPLHTDRGYYCRMHFVLVLNLVWNEWEKKQCGFRQLPVVSTVLNQCWSQAESCKLRCISAGQSLLGSAVKKTSFFLSVSNEIEFVILCLWMSPHLSSRVSPVGVQFPRNFTQRPNVGVELCALLLFIFAFVLIEVWACRSTNK